MSIEQKRKQNEPFNVFLRKFSEQVRRSGIIPRYKKGKFRVKPKSRNVQKASALERKKRGQKLSYLRKIGKIK